MELYPVSGPRPSFDQTVQDPLLSTWDPVVNPVALGGSGVVDVLVLAGAGPDVPTPAGTLLIDLGAIAVVQSAPAGIPFAVPVPASCGLVGGTIRAQAASFDLSGAYALTNALDARIGTH